MALRLVVSHRNTAPLPHQKTAGKLSFRGGLADLLEQPFHYCRGRDGRRYLHTVFSLIHCPELPKANYVLVHRDAEGRRTPLAVGQTTEDSGSLNLARLRWIGARLRANEIHLYLLAETPQERQAVENDLRASLLGVSHTSECDFFEASLPPSSATHLN